MSAIGVPNDRLRALATELVDGPRAGESEELAATAVWSCLVEPGDGVAGRLVGRLGAAAALRLVVAGGGDRRTVESAEISAPQWRQALARWRLRIDDAAVERALAHALRCGIRLLVPGDERWPAALHDLGPHAPLALWARGDIALLGRADASVAIVGARASTGYGEHVAAEIAAELAGRGIVVVSGAAYGIDGAAHRAALRTGGTTIALLAGGLDRPYPAGHADLLERIARQGAVLSEVPCGGAPTRWRFLHQKHSYGKRS